MDSIAPTAEDINKVFRSNPQAAQQLQIITLTRLLEEKEQEIESLKSKIASNGKGSVKNLEKVT